VSAYTRYGGLHSTGHRIGTSRVYTSSFRRPCTCFWLPQVLGGKAREPENRRGRSGEGTRHRRTGARRSSELRPKYPAAGAARPLVFGSKQRPGGLRERRARPMPSRPVRPSQTKAAAAAAQATRVLVVVRRCRGGTGNLFFLCPRVGRTGRPAGCLAGLHVWRCGLH
jgi:hypothetical protein